MAGQCSAVQCGAVRCGAVRCGAVRCGAAVQCTAVLQFFLLSHGGAGAGGGSSKLNVKGNTG